MNLPSPVTVTYLAVIGPLRETKELTVTFDKLNVTIMDNAERRQVAAMILPCPRPLPLWSGDEYTAVGDYTQSQAEARVLEVLGSDPASVIRGLFPKVP